MSAIVYLIGAAISIAIAQRITRFSRAAALILVLLPLLFTGRALVRGAVFGPVDLSYTFEPLASIANQSGVGAVVNPAISDVSSQFIPWNDSLRRSIARGEWPLWDPFALCGTPQAGSAQSSPYHPITILGLLMPAREYFGFAAAMMMLSAALTAFLLFREFVSTEIAALFGAAAWMCSTHLVFFAGTALVLAASITPLVLLGARRIVRRPGRKSVVILTVALLLVVLAGHPESALHIVAFSIAYFLFELLNARRTAPIRIVLVSGLTAGAFALLLSAIFLLPLIEVISQTEEYLHRESVYRQVSSTPVQMLHRLTASAFPFREGAPGVEERTHEANVRHGWLPTSYAGSMLFAPAIFALLCSRSRQRWFFLAAVIAGSLISIAAPGVTQILGHLPGFSIAVNDRMIVFAVLGTCALAAMGIDLADRSIAVSFLAIAVVILIVACLPTDLGPNYVRVNAARAILPVLLAACAMFVLTKERAVLVLFALLLIQRGGEASSLQPTLPASSFYPPFPGLEVMRSDQPFRIVGVGAMLPPQVSTHYGLEDVRGFQATTLDRFRQTYALWCVGQAVWSNRVDRLDSPFLSMMNTRFAIVPPTMPLPDGWIERRRFPAYAIVENTRALPRAYVPRTVRVDIEGVDSVRDIAAIRDFGGRSVISDRMASEWAANGPGSVVIQENRGAHMTMSVHMDGPGWVIVSNAHWRGWHARTSGHEIPIRFANHTFIGFYLDAGEHIVKLIYRPRAFVIGAWISGFALIAFLAYALIPSSAMTFFMSFQTSFLADGVRRRYAG
jgi:Bacterial membrane protein YfhO